MAGSVYSAESDLNLDATRLIELTDNTVAPGVKDQTLLDALSFEAQDIVDEELAGVYAVPFTAGNVPSPIKRIHAKLWRYLLFDHRDTLAVPESVREDNKEAMAKLDDYAKPGDGGRFLLGVTPSGNATAPTANAGTFSSDIEDTYTSSRIFGRYRDKLG